MVTPAAKRNTVAQLIQHYQMSERRACKTTGFCRMTARFETRHNDGHDLRERMKVLAYERRRFGYRRLHVLLKCEEKLTVRKRGGRKRVIGTRAPMAIPIAANDR